MMKNIKDLFVESPRLLRNIVWGTAALLLGIGGVWWLILDTSTYVSNNQKKDLPEVATPHTVVSSKELWVNRIEGQANRLKTDMDEKVEEIRVKDQLLHQRLDVINNALENIVQKQMEQDLLYQQRKKSENLEETSEEISLDDGQFQKAVAEGREAVFPSQNNHSKNIKEESLKSQPDAGYALLSLSKSEKELLPKEKLKVVEEVIPAGSFVEGVLISGVPASTALQSQSDPQMAMVRLTAPGTLSKGFKSDVEGAFLTTACYGDISSERAYCRLHTLHLVEPNGEVISKKVEGWIIGDDGIMGIKGKVVDKAGPLIRAAFWDGLLGSISSYFKAAAQQPQFVLTGGGAVETQKVSNQTLLQTAGANGVGNALEKIADYALRRAEMMQPVIMINPGRRIDIVFKEDVDLSQSTFREEIVSKEVQERFDHAIKEAARISVQLKNHTGI